LTIQRLLEKLRSFTMATPSLIDANPRNAQKSTGLRTEESKDRSRFHAVKQGVDASVPTLGRFSTRRATRADQP
ncbi:MAG: hypothetical protein ACHRXM_40335, partial [Isosphaerales bacterium]